MVIFSSTASCPAGPVEASDPCAPWIVLTTLHAGKTNSPRRRGSLSPRPQDVTHHYVANQIAEQPAFHVRVVKVVFDLINHTGDPLLDRGKLLLGRVELRGDRRFKIVPGLECLFVYSSTPRLISQEPPANLLEDQTLYESRGNQRKPGNIVLTIRQPR